MRTRSTCVALSFAAICGMSMTTTGCSPDSQLPVAATTGDARAVSEGGATLSEQAAWMGKYHNDALDFALKRIKASRKTSKLDRCKVGIAALKEFQKAYAKTASSAVFQDLSLSDGACEAAAQQSEFSPAKSFNIGNAGPRADISLSASNYMNQIVSEVDYASSALSLSFAVNRIVNRASYTVDPLEASAVAGTGSITVNSATYWEANEGAWSQPNQLQYSQMTDGMENIPVAPANISARAKAIIKADATAAVTTLLANWFLGEGALATACIRAAAASLAAGIFFSI